MKRPLDSVRRKAVRQPCTAKRLGTVDAIIGIVLSLSRALVGALNPAAGAVQGLRLSLCPRSVTDRERGVLQGPCPLWTVLCPP